MPMSSHQSPLVLKSNWKKTQEICIKEDLSSYIRSLLGDVQSHKNLQTVDHIFKRDYYNNKFAQVNAYGPKLVRFLKNHVLRSLIQSTSDDAHHDAVTLRRLFQEYNKSVMQENFSENQAIKNKKTAYCKIKCLSIIKDPEKNQRFKELSNDLLQTYSYDSIQSFDEYYDSFHDLVPDIIVAEDVADQETLFYRFQKQGLCFTVGGDNSDNINYLNIPWDRLRSTLENLLTYQNILFPKKISLVSKEDTEKQVNEFVHTQLGENKVNIIFAEDQKIFRKEISKFFKPFPNFTCKVFEDGMQLLEHLPEEKPDLIILDYSMPEMNGDEVLQRIRTSHKNSEVPVLIMSSSHVHLNLFSISKGARAFLSKTEFLKNPPHFFSTIIPILIEQKKYRNKVEEITFQYVENLEESKHLETREHTERVKDLSVLIASKLGKNEEYLKILKETAPIHDIGKVEIPLNILDKPGKLSAEERAVMETHCKKGRDFIQKSMSHVAPKKVIMACDIALNHHEKWDGTGYPQGKKGEEIPLAGRIVALADVFDALVSKRCYKEPWPMDKVYKVICEESGKHFDPELVDIFIQYLSEFINIMKAPYKEIVEQD